MASDAFSASGGERASTIRGTTRDWFLAHPNGHFYNDPIHDKVPKTLHSGALSVPCPYSGFTALREKSQLLNLVLKAVSRGAATHFISAASVTQTGTY